MDFESARAAIDAWWDRDVMPALTEYVGIPCESPAFDTGWATSGHLERAVTLLSEWAARKLGSIEGATVEIIRPKDRTASIFIDIPGAPLPPVLIYGHYDKQPPMDGWAGGRGAWTPVIEGDRLYGRGGADDGYALFSAVLAVLALREQGLSHPPIRILIEGSEESVSDDLIPTLDLLGDRLGEPAVLIALDAGCGNYDQLWLTSSLRGQVAGSLTVRTLREGVHSGDASGIIPSSFRVARLLLSRVEDPETGEIADEAFRTQIPPEHRAQAAAAGAALGNAIHASFPVPGGARPVAAEPAQQLLNRAWRPQLTVTGLDGLPAASQAGAVSQPWVRLKLSLRLPPTVDPQSAGRHLKALLEADPPYGSDVSFAVDLASPGWRAPPMDPELAAAVDEASRLAFSRPSASFGGGGGIPFLALLGERFPGVQFVVTGVLGPQSNAHGPNEFLHLPTARRLTAALACLLRIKE